MRHAETVTFGGGAAAGWDRAAALRAAPERIADLLSADSTRVLPLWRGKVLLAGHGDRLGMLAPGDPVLLEPGGEAVFLGLGPHGAVFAQDISGWEPDNAKPVEPVAFFDASVQRHPGLPADFRFAELRSAMTALSAVEAEIAATARAITGWHQTHGFCARCGARSAVAMAGWQRNCPDCGAHHFPRTDPVVIMLVTRGNSVLLGRSPGWPERMYSLLAGFVEPGETLEAAVRREVEEETGVRIGAVSYLASQPWPFPANLMFGCHGAALSTAITVDPAEIEDARWLTREDMAAVMAGLDADIAAPRDGAIARFLIEAWLADRLD